MSSNDQPVLIEDIVVGATEVPSYRLDKYVLIYNYKIQITVAWDILLSYV